MSRPLPPWQDAKRRSRIRRVASPRERAPTGLAPLLPDRVWNRVGLATTMPSYASRRSGCIRPHVRLRIVWARAHIRIGTRQRLVARSKACVARAGRAGARARGCGGVHELCPHQNGLDDTFGAVAVYESRGGTASSRRRCGSAPGGGRLRVACWGRHRLATRRRPRTRQLLPGAGVSAICRTIVGRPRHRDSRRVTPPAVDHDVGRSEPGPVDHLRRAPSGFANRASRSSTGRQRSALRLRGISAATAVAIEPPRSPDRHRPE